MKTKARNSNIEFLRILSLLLIIFGHFTWHTNWNFTGVPIQLRIMIHTLWIGGKLGVDIFVLISGYYLIESKFKKKSVIRTWLIAYFYSFVILCVAIITGFVPVGIKNVIKTLFMASSGNINWFVTAYLIMYLLSPFLNRLLRSLSKNQFRTVLAIFIIIAGAQTIFHNPAVGTGGYDASWLLIVYSFGAYIRLYTEDFRSKSGTYVGLLVCSLLLSALSVAVLDYAQINYHISNSATFYSRFINGTSPFQLFSAIMIFLIFIRKNFWHNQVINKIASTTFAIYLIHDNGLVSGWIWNTVVSPNRFVHTYFIVIYELIVTILIFAICCCIDLVRQRLFAKGEMRLVNKLSGFEFWDFFKEV